MLLVFYPTPTKNPCPLTHQVPWVIILISQVALLIHKSNKQKKKNQILKESKSSHIWLTILFQL
jgi:hypothetical protein